MHFPAKYKNWFDIEKLPKGVKINHDNDCHIDMCLKDNYYFINAVDENSKLVISFKINFEELVKAVLKPPFKPENN